MGGVDFEPVQWENDMSDTHDFDLEEFKALRQEILQKVDAISKLEVLAIGGAAAVYAWLGTRTVPTPRLIWFIPLLFPVLGWLRAHYLGRQVSMAGGYLEILEKRLRPVPLLGPAHGWEGYIRLPHIQEKFVDPVSNFFWCVFVCLTVVIPFLFSPR